MTLVTRIHDRTCVLLTSTFPIRGETFVWYEIEYLSKVFDHVHVYSTSIGHVADCNADGVKRLMSFENVSYKGDISALTPRLVMPVPVILNEFLIAIEASFNVFMIYVRPMSAAYTRIVFMPQSGKSNSR